MKQTSVKREEWETLTLTLKSLSVLAPCGQITDQLRVEPQQTDCSGTTPCRCRWKPSWFSKAATVEGAVRDLTLLKCKKLLIAPTKTAPSAGGGRRVEQQFRTSRILLLLQPLKWRRCICLLSSSTPPHIQTIKTEKFEPQPHTDPESDLEPPSSLLSPPPPPSTHSSFPRPTAPPADMVLSGVCHLGPDSSRVLLINPVNPQQLIRFCWWWSSGEQIKQGASDTWINEWIESVVLGEENISNINYNYNIKHLSVEVSFLLGKKHKENQQINPDYNLVFL